jgi:hypothetical protein
VAVQALPGAGLGLVPAERVRLASGGPRW